MGLQRLIKLADITFNSDLLMQTYSGIAFRNLLSSGLCLLLCALSHLANAETTDAQHSGARLLNSYCGSCHTGDSPEGNFDLVALLQKTGRSEGGEIPFEHVITGRMPPSDAEQPSAAERSQMTRFLASRSDRASVAARRRSRFEFNQSANDLLGIQHDVASSMPEDRGTNRFDTDSRIRLSVGQMSAYFDAAEKLLDVAFPQQGFMPEGHWSTNRLRDSHHTYNVYTRPYRDGILFSWTRANNGNSYSFFYEDFYAPVAGWYEVSIDAAKVGSFEEDIAIQTHAGKYYFADDRPQPQRLLDVISVSDRNVRNYKVRGYFQPGENLSVHCVSQHTWRKTDPEIGAYIERVQVRGPLHQWPPKSFSAVFPDLPVVHTERDRVSMETGKSTLERIGGALFVSSSEAGREKERMLDGSNRTGWQSKSGKLPGQFPHHVLIRNPSRAVIDGLRYATVSGGDGIGQVKRYTIFASDNGVDWLPIKRGELLTRLAATQEILFPESINASSLKFLIEDTLSSDDMNYASIGTLDVISETNLPISRLHVKINSANESHLERVIRRFSFRALSGKVDESALAAQVALAKEAFRNNGNFVASAKLAIKGILCSRQFLLPGTQYSNESYRIAAELARVLWLSVPDQDLLRLAASDGISESIIREQIDRMLADPRARRMAHSFTNQWLNLRAFEQVTPSLKLYPLYDDLLNHFLPLEAESYLLHLMRHNLSVSHLIDSDFAFLNQRLARHYGVEGVVGHAMRKVTLPAGSLRGGFMTMGSVLKITTDGQQSSPIRRGAWVSEVLVGNTLAPPPENVSSIEPDSSGATTIREQLELHKEKESCAVCHQHMDPYGFALESFDATGQFRDRYRAIRPHGGTFGYARGGHYSLSAAVDSSGEVDDTGFNDVAGLKKILLASSDKIAYNMMKQYFEYANGRQPTLVERVELFERIPDRAGDWGVKDLMTEVLLMSLRRNRDV